MQCPCGGATKDHEVVKNHKLVGLYRKCVACGRILWVKEPADIAVLRGGHNGQR